MIFLLFCALALLALAWWIVWRRWISPWHDARELVEAISENKRPRTFLLTGNEQAHRFGLVLEKLWEERTERETRAHERESRVQAILAALPDGFVPRRATLRVTDAQGHPQAMRIYFVRSASGQGG